MTAFMTELSGWDSDIWGHYFVVLGLLQITMVWLQLNNILNAVVISVLWYLALFIFSLLVDIYHVWTRKEEDVGFKHCAFKA